MEELQSKRRRQAQEDLGLTTQRERREIEHSIKKEEQRKARKGAKRLEIMNSSSYRTAHAIAKYMDKYYFDPIIGFFIPGFGDAVTSFFVVPFIYVSAIKIRSLPLTLAVIYNILVDILVGLMPFYIGDICDIFNKAYVKNARLVDGFVEDDKTIIEEVNQKAIWMGVMIVIVCFLIYLMVLLVMKITEWIGSAWDWLVGLF